MLIKDNSNIKAIHNRNGVFSNKLFSRNSFEYGIML